MQQLLDQDTIEFLQSGEIALCLASSDAQRMSSLTETMGCKVASDKLTITTWLSKNGHESLLTNISNSGRLAMVACHVQTFRAMQLKAFDARVLPFDKADYPLVLAYQQGFIRKTVSLGYPEAVMRVQKQFRVDQLVAVQFTPSSGFTQTPGPNAGAALVLSATS
jgi:hypothetical protein